MASEMAVAEPSKVAIDCQFATAQLGDVLKLPPPFKLPGAEVEAKLVSITGPEGLRLHVYELRLFGVWFGRVSVLEGTILSPAEKWKVVT